MDRMQVLIEDRYVLESYVPICGVIVARDHIVGFLTPRKPFDPEGLLSVGMPIEETLPKVSTSEQFAAWQSRILPEMSDETYILKVEKDSHDGLIVTFSDGTTAGYVVEELLSLRPLRELTHEPVKKNPPQPSNAN
jgi:hypothetical protein